MGGYDIFGELLFDKRFFIESLNQLSMKKLRILFMQSIR
jgi:hypothetical protein